MNQRKSYVYEETKENKTNLDENSRITLLLNKASDGNKRLDVKIAVHIKTRP